MCNEAEVFICRNGRKVTISFDEATFDVNVRDVNGESVGGLRFNEQDGQLLLTWAYLDQLGPDYVRQGIGRRCLQIASQFSGMPIVARDNDGIQRDDGSHLTGDAPQFVARMRTEGLIS